jgi:aminoglycoside phosphotransferase (APT) family kinase protein
VSHVVCESAAKPGIRDVVLQDALQQVLDGHRGPRRRIVSLNREPSPYRSSCTLEQLSVRLDGGEALALIFKDLGPDALSEDARRIRPGLIYNARREIDVYRHVLTVAPPGPPCCHGAVVDDAASRYWLFLERVAGRELYQVGDIGVWQDVARWLASLHARFADVPLLDNESCTHHLLRHDEALFRLWHGRALSFLEQNSGGDTSACRHIIEWLSTSYDRVIRRLLTLPSTFIHGECYASNVLVQTGDELRVCPVDWEMAAIGPGLMDLAALTAGWKGEQRTTIALAYYDALLATETGWRPPVQEFLGALDCCRLQAALQWLGWAVNWAPPIEHRHDWLGDVSHVIAGLRL